jgi:RNA polymerase sigma-70 factor (ECF subfamily)
VAETGTEQLLDRAATGDEHARDLLLTRHRDRLTRMVAVRADPRLAARVDPSDVVQEALADAAHKLDGYLRDRPLPFYPWLRRLAWERIVLLHRRHVRAQRRSVTREEREMQLPDGSVLDLARHLAASSSGPSGRLRRDELQMRLRAALAQLRDADREVLVLRHLEGLSARDIAAVLDISEAAVNTRHVRALHRLRSVLGPDYAEGE